LAWGLTPAVALAQPNTGKVSFSAGLDFSHAYFFRGIRQEDEGFIAQPYGEIAFDLFEDAEGLNTGSLALGFWNSLHSGPTGSGNIGGLSQNTTAWYRSDFYAGLSLGLVGHWQAGVVYAQYMSPNDRFSTIKELALSLGFDDSEWMGDLALSPYVTLAIEVAGNAAGIDEGVYVELGIEPGVEPGLPLEDLPLSLTFPVTLGLSLSDYYQDALGANDAFGYFDLGILGSVPLLRVSESYGSWEVSGGVHLLFLGDTLEALNAGDQFQAIGSFGLSIGY
jgi:hypothetical protein